jgi:hypothetical protein
MQKTKPAITAIKSSTQSFLEIADIKDGIVILKDGSCVLALSTTAINFGLLSEKEQDAAIYAYGALLNSLTFSVQILIRSKRKDITSYLKLLAEQEKKTAQRSLREQIQKYREFIESTVQVNNVLEKSFYLIIPMSFLEIGIAPNVSTKILTGKRKDLPFPKEYILEKAKTNLYPKKDHLVRLLNRLGLRSKQLTTQELVKLFFEIYNPSSHGQILSATEDYQTPLVKPAASFLETAAPTPIPTTPQPTGETPTPTAPAKEQSVPPEPSQRESAKKTPGPTEGAPTKEAQKTQSKPTEKPTLEKKETHPEPSQKKPTEKPTPTEVSDKGKKIKIEPGLTKPEQESKTQNKIDELVQEATSTGSKNQPIFESSNLNSQPKSK